jgi:ligand-binding sensor protein
MDELSSDYYSILTKKLGLKEQLDVSHQTMRDSTQGKHVKYAEGISGLIHFLVPVHDGDREIGFIRCGGMKDAYRGMLKFMNFSQELKDQDHDEEKIAELESAFKNIPNLHGENLAEATSWLAQRAKEIDKEITEINNAS